MAQYPQLLLTFFRASQPLPSVLPKQGTFEEAQRLAETHRCVVVMHDPSASVPFRGCVGPDGTYTRQDLSNPKQSLAVRRSYRSKNAVNENEINVWGAEGMGDNEVLFRAPRGLQAGGRRVVRSFRAADAAGIATEACAAPKRYVLAINLRHTHSEFNWEVVLEGDALAAAVDRAGVTPGASRSTVRSVFVFTADRDLEHATFQELNAVVNGPDGILVAVAFPVDVASGKLETVDPS